ncbi:17023_t:CDS:2 [Dentiscutata erythropus]|uniref:17023_t:CDS:1 n=1 Tax=Dentiscutata erythropus TaxID=1348616 RepID=A0A9N9EG67_9GLOM|nr:17023_t:CDS:2 [Dentiscutata erythropus]
MAELISFKDVFEIDKEKLSFITEDDMRFAWHYITLFYDNKPCSLDDFKLYDDDNSYEYPKIKNDNGTESFLFKTKSNLYFKNDLICQLFYNEYKLTDFRKNGKISYTINIDKNLLFNDNRVEEIEVENDSIRDYYKLKDNIGHYFILYSNSVIKHIGTYNYFDYYDVEDNISEKNFIKNGKSIEFLFNENILEKPTICSECNKTNFSLEDKRF